MLENRDYTLIIDKSGSMSKKDQEGNKSRWNLMEESTFALASKCEEFDPDGITIYTFSRNFKRYDNVNSSKVEQIFSENEPKGNTALAEVLQDALQNYLQRKIKPENKRDGETILVVTDGKPDDQEKVAKVIIQATQDIEKEKELAICFIQIGNEKEAADFLNFLDDELKSMGAKYDIVTTVSLLDIENEELTFKEVLLRAIDPNS
ncbi:VWA domain-containing protein [Calothrix sp. PCC 6303]|uniref:VWA domain-containing protein n=1 Tax=Calothrix sp. PCC 6303 TaxID=1170562 RepID=UPI0002A02F86|nr:VWA domain-containing protein [Calothrix sp. PCC 6303]AFZ04576.1 von Willebrand factor type A [Calothrix sp. PCC 6303]